MFGNFISRKQYSHKGENGRLFIIGGSEKYHGAPILSILSSRRFVDLVYFYPAEKDSKDELIRTVRCNIPEVIILKNINESSLKKIDEFALEVGLEKIIEEALEGMEII